MIPACPTGHPYTVANLYLKWRLEWRVRAQRYVLVHNRECMECRRAQRRANSRRRRAEGKQASYPVWVARKVRT